LIEPQNSTEITEILEALTHGNPQAARQLLPHVYDELPAVDAALVRLAETDAEARGDHRPPLRIGPERVLLIDPDQPHDAAALSEIADVLPFLEVQLVEQADFMMLVDRFYSTDRDCTPNGLVEVTL